MFIHFRWISALIKQKKKTLKWSNLGVRLYGYLCFYNTFTKLTHVNITISWFGLIIDRSIATGDRVPKTKSPINFNHFYYVFSVRSVLSPITSPHKIWSSFWKVISMSMHQLCVRMKPKKKGRDMTLITTWFYL